MCVCVCVCIHTQLLIKAHGYLCDSKIFQNLCISDISS